MEFELLVGILGVTIHAATLRDSGVTDLPGLHTKFKARKHLPGGGGIHL